MIEILVVLAYSPRTQFALVLGLVSLTGFILAGEHLVGQIKLHGLLEPLTEVVRERIGHRYDKAAWASLASCLLLAVKFYRKDRDPLLRL